MNHQFLVDKMKAVCNYKDDLSIVPYECDSLEVESEDGIVRIGYSSISDFCRGVCLSIMHLRKGETTFSIKQTHNFERAGFMIDVSYDGVMSVEGLKQYIDYMASAGLNMLMLYTEDTYEVKKYPQMGYLRGRYSQEELREIDQYANEMGVELIGCIQTLGHLEHIVKWNDFADITENETLILPGEERTYEFIEECIKTISENISSRHIHVGLDEAFGLGEGKYKIKHGKCDPLEIYAKHVKRVYDICVKYGLHPMMWSDCFFRFSMRETGYGIQYSATEPISSEILKLVPEHMDMVYWEYEEKDKNVYRDIINAHKVFSGETVMATACWNWDGQLPRLNHAFATQGAALEAAKECGVKTILSTDWQHCNNSADYFFTLPSIVFYGQHRYGDDTSKEMIEKILRSNTGMELSAIDIMNVYHGNEYLEFHGGEKYFYCSTLINTVGIPEGNPEQEFRQAARALAKYQSDVWGRHYKFAELIMEIAATKCEIYNKLRKAYVAGDRDFLTNVSSKILPTLIQKYRDALAIKKELWLESQKPFGLDSVSRYYGGCIADVEYAIDRLENYLTGRINCIEELDEEVMPFKKASVVVDYSHI